MPSAAAASATTSDADDASAPLVALDADGCADADGRAEGVKAATRDGDAFADSDAFADVDEDALGRAEPLCDAFADVVLEDVDAGDADGGGLEADGASDWPADRVGASGASGLQSSGR